MIFPNNSFQNMVGPGEVDDMLEAEVSEECSKYGKVVKCMIYEVSLVSRVEGRDDRTSLIVLIA